MNDEKKCFIMTCFLDIIEYNLDLPEELRIKAMNE